METSNYKFYYWQICRNHNEKVKLHKKLRKNLHWRLTHGHLFQAKAFTIKDLSEATQIPQKTLTKYVINEKNYKNIHIPTITNINRLSKIYQCNYEELLISPKELENKYLKAWHVHIH